MENLIARLINTTTDLLSNCFREWIPSFLSLITGNDMLVLFCIALPLVGLGIGLIRRLVRIRA